MATYPPGIGTPVTIVFWCVHCGRADPVHKSRRHRLTALVLDALLLVDQIGLLEELARTTGGVVRAQVARQNGLRSWQLTRLARAGVIARVAKGVYLAGQPRRVPAPWTATTTLIGVLSDESAAAWWGIELPRPPAQVHVTVPRNRGRRSDAVRGVRLHRANLERHEIVTVRGVRVTTPLRTALDIARRAALEDAICVLDAFLRAGLVRLEELEREVARAVGPGRVRMIQVAMLTDPNSGSVLESLTRLVLWRKRMSPPVTQWSVVCTATPWSGRLDFAWPALKVALECDGYEWHRERTHFERDRRRWSTLTRMGWLVGVVTWFDVTTDPAYVVGLVADLLAAAHNRDG